MIQKLLKIEKTINNFKAAEETKLRIIKSQIKKIKDNKVNSEPFLN